MNKTNTFFTLLLILAVNIVALSIKKWTVIIPLFLVVCVVGSYITSFRQVIKRTFIFIGVGCSIFVFQIVFVRSIYVSVLFIQSMRIAIQLFIVSEVVRVGVAHISPVSLLSLFSFLPKHMRLLICMTFYFVPLTMQEYGVIRNAQLSRGSGRTLISKLMTPIACLIPLLHRVFQRSEILTYSVLSRGWEGDEIAAK